MHEGVPLGVGIIQLKISMVYKRFHYKTPIVWSGANTKSYNLGSLLIDQCSGIREITKEMEIYAWRR